MDRIKIIDLEVFANHGVFLEESKLGQKFLVSAVMHADLQQACTSDCLQDSIDYGAACRLIDHTMRLNTFDLIERAAEEVAQVILKTFPSVERVDVEIKKPWAPIGLPVAYASVIISRMRKVPEKSQPVTTCKEVTLYQGNEHAAKS